jgi:hypothetical protein
MDEAKQYCNCLSCRTQPNSPALSFLQGQCCVRLVAFEEVLIFMGHSIAN